MPELTHVKTLEELVEDQSLAVQSKSVQIIDITIGSILRALLEAVGGMGLWLQSLVVEMLKKSRASTSEGGDLDSWVADYGLVRLPAVKATGLLTLQRITVSPLSPSILIPAVSSPAQFETSIDKIKFQVTIDSSDDNWSNAQGGYLLPVGASTIVVPIEAIVAGRTGNVSANSIDTAITPLTGIDLIYNTASLANGRDAETDDKLRARFIAYISSLSKATRDAIGFAVSSVRQDVKYSITENVEYESPTAISPDLKPGYFYVVIDDGTGDPSDELVSAVANAIELTRGFTISYSVYKVSVVHLTIDCLIYAHPGYMHSTLQSTVRTAIIDFMNSLNIGEALSFTKLAEQIYAASPGVKNVTDIQINGENEPFDWEINPKQVIKPSTVVVEVTD